MTESTTAAAEPRRPYTFRRQLDALEAALPMETYLKSSGTKLEPFGGRAWFVSCCPMPDHEDKTPSFYVYPPGRAWCYGCSRGGDLLKLFMLVEGWPAGTHGEALAALADRFGVDLPRPSEQRLARIGEKARIRDAATKRIAAVYQRRLTRLYAPLVLVGGESAEEELEELQELAAALWPVSLDMARRRVSGA